MSPHTHASKRKRSGSGSARRAHRKSRNGCLECKRRHIKCDEAQPACSNCVVSERTCSFPSTAALSAAQTPNNAPTPASVPTIATLLSHTISLSHTAPSIISSGQFQSPAGHCSSPGTIHSEAYIVPTSTSFSYAPLGIPTIIDDYIHFPTTLPSFIETYTPTTPADSPGSTTAGDSSQPLFTAQHLILLNHAMTKMPLTDGYMQPVVDMTIEWTQAAPYATYQLLALAADHFAIQSPTRDKSYRRIATELQTRALMDFNRSNQELENASEADREKFSVPRFLFANLLSIHMLYGTFAYYRASFHLFIERFLESVSLHRGVRTIISTMYGTLLNTGLRPFFLNMPDAEVGIEHSGTECSALINVIESSDLPPSSIAACRSAAETLQWAFNVHAHLPASDNTHAATAFPVLLTADFVDNVRKHRPEGLIVLAYYGVLLHRCRRSWVIGDAGSFLVRLIADYLGSYWQESLHWPLEELDREDGKEDKKGDGMEVG